MLEFQPLPVFKNGMALGASDLNLINMAMQYLGEGPPINYALREISMADRRVLLHRYRYLHWRMWDNPVTSGGTIEIGNNENVYPTTGTSGYIDLDGLGLSTDSWYDVQWKHTDGDDTPHRCMYFMEHPTTDGSLTLPYPLHDFSIGGVTEKVSDEDHLNAITGNLEFLMNQYRPDIQVGFPGFFENLRPHPSDGMRRDVYFYARRTFRYLHVVLRHIPRGEEANREVQVRIYTQADEANCYTMSRSGNDNRFLEMYIDLEGSDHQMMMGDADAVFTDPPAIAMGEWYQINIRATANLPASADVWFYMIAEMPNKDRRML